MPDAELQPVIAALKAGEKQRARRRLRPLLRQPTADRWYMAALLCETPQQAIVALERALRIDPDHSRAARRLAQLQNAAAPQTEHETISEDDLPPLAALVADEVVIPTVKPYNPQPATTRFFESLRRQPIRPRPRRKRSIHTYIVIASAILLSLSSTYFVLLVLGSGIPGQLRGYITGAHPALAGPDATVVFATPIAVIDGTPYYAGPLEGFGSTAVDATPVTEIQGTPVYARPDAVVVVEPARSVPLTRNQPISDILEPGYAHEYTFSTRQGEEIAVGIQFFSPTAQQVGRNVTVLDPDGRSAEGVCQRDRILQGDNGVVFICPVHRSGEWRVRLFGREGESSGAYVVAIETFA
ncbi:MAG TPA: tetratricopeptide repeat protein [Spirillospora sp.]|nr:tetratricopeptide repeat protein [Spirillospora sp.]